MADAPDEEIDRLYGLPLEEFIPARDALARELRDAGRRGEATAVKGLRKPTVAAWAANQAVRSQPRAARELWDAGDALASAQEAVLSGKGSGADLREAAERERLALDPLIEAARGLLTASGGDLAETTIDKVRATLQAAAIDEDAREEVAAGRATRERTPRGLFGVEAPIAAPSGGGGSGAPAAGRSATRGRSASTRGRSAGAGTEEKAARGRSGKAARDRSAAPDRSRPSSPDRAAGRGRGRSASPERSAADRAREREEAAAARKREREEKAARERARKAAAARVARAENALAAAEARSAKAAEQLEEARTREREAVEALADARADLRAHER
jgi:hypothetical protein